MNGDFSYIPSLEGTPEEQAWLRERLETLSVRESYALAAVTSKTPPQNTREAIGCLYSLDNCKIRFPTGSYKELGKFALRQNGSLPDEVLPYVDLTQVGQQYEDAHPGLFIGECYVCYPTRASPANCQESASPTLADSGWSVKLKLASPAVPEGVWLRLPDYDGVTHEGAGEVELALHELKAGSLDESTLLEVQCILPQAGDLAKQYDSVSDLVWNGNDLGFILDERGQGEPHWMERFTAALEYENCCTLRHALDISQNLSCYEWVPRDGLKDFAENHLRSCGVSEELIQSGAVDWKRYAEDLLETAGYLLTSSGEGYVTRNARPFNFEYCTQEDADSLTAVKGESPTPEPVREAYVLPENFLDELPFLARLAARTSPYERAQAEQDIREALKGRGPEGLRHLQAAMDCSDCADLKSAAEIAEDLDHYDFIEVDGFRETAKKELMAKGLSEQVVDFCFNLETYAAITHDFESIYQSTRTGLYVHWNYFTPKEEQGGMSSQSM